MELLMKALKAYNAFVAAEYESSRYTLKKFTSEPAGILYTENEDETIEIQLSYDALKTEYILELTTENDVLIYREFKPLDAFIDDMKNNDFSSMFDWCIDAAEEQFNINIA